jgi:hypothetical protein
MAEKENKVTPIEKVKYEGHVLNPQANSKAFAEFEFRPIDQLRWLKKEDGSISYVSDVALLLNSERIINEIGEANYNLLVRSFGMPSKRYAKGNFDDDLLLQSVKSRFIQTPSELRAWQDQWVEIAAGFEAEVNKRAKEQKEAAIASKAAELAQRGQAATPVQTE